MLNGKSLIIWGDSLAKGVIYDGNKNKYSVLEHNVACEAAATLNLKLINRSKFGLTASKGLELVEKDIENNITGDLALIEFGGNDCDFNWREISDEPDAIHNPRTPLGIFEDKIRAIVTKVKQKGIRPILASLPPLDAERYFNFISRGLNANNILKWLGDKYQIYRWHERYSLTICSLARAENCELLDLRSAFLACHDFRHCLCDDGIHLNEKGHALLKEAVVSYSNMLNE